MKITNPIVAGFYPDPSVCRVGQDYYLVNSSFEYFPGVPVFHSRDLLNWRQIGHCLTRPGQLPLNKAPSSGGIYAPTIRYQESSGRFYMVTTNVSQGGHFYVYTRDPGGEWSEPVWVGGDIQQADGSFDPSLFFDEEGTVYFTCTDGQQRIVQFEIDLATGKQRSEMRIISTGTGGKSPEGPHLYKINNLYYLMLAEGGTEYGHFESISRSPSPWGPFEPCPHNPILTHRSTNQPIQATGHADLFQAENGAWWLVCLGIRPSGYPPYHHIGRETYLAPVRWTADGWPVVGYEGKIDLEMEAGQLPPAAPLIKNETRDDFERAELGLDWNFLRNPYPEQYSLTERPGWLRLKGSAVTLNDVDSPAFLGRRQRHFNCSATTRVDFEPQQDRQEAGLTVLMNERHHYEIAVTRLNGLRQVIVRRRIGSLAAVVAHFNVEPGPLDLQVIANRDEYRFRFAAGGQEFVEAASGEARYLATETAGGFTGVYLGMYSSGKGTADFDWFEYRENVFSTTPGSRL